MSGVSKQASRRVNDSRDFTFSLSIVHPHQRKLRGMFNHSAENINERNESRGDLCEGKVEGTYVKVKCLLRPLTKGFRTLVEPVWSDCHQSIY